MSVNIEKFDGIAEDPSTKEANSQVRHCIWGSVRLTYTICAFFGMVLHLCMRNALSLAILCMVKIPTNAPSNSTDDPALQAAMEEFSTCGTLELNTTNIQIISDNAEFNWSRSQQFLLLGCFYYGYLITLPIGGRLCDKFGGKLFFIYSLILQSIAFGLMPFFARLSYEAIVGIRVIQGLIAGFGNPSVYQLYTVWSHPSERTALMSFGYGGYSVGSLLVFPLASALCNFGWPTVFYCIGSISFVYGVCCHWLIYSTLDKHPRISDAETEYLKSNNQHTEVPTIPWKSILTSMPVFAFLITHICHTFGTIVLTLLLPTFLRKAIRFSLNETGLYSSVPFAGSCLSKVITVTSCTLIQTKCIKDLTVFRRVVYFTCNVLTILFFIGIILVDCSHKVFIVLLILFIGVATDIAFSGAYWVSLLDCAPAFAGLLSGISNSFATLVASMAPLGISELIKVGSKSEWNMVFITMICAYGFSAIVYGSCGSSELQVWAKPPIKETRNETDKNIS